MKVAGITGQQEVYVSSDERNFRINEFLLIEDPLQGDLLGEIVVAHTFNPYIPLNLGGEVADDRMLDALRSIGYEVDRETVYVGKLRLLAEASYPVQTGASLRIPTFDEVRKYFLRTSVSDGMILGVIKNTDVVAQTMDEELKQITETFEDGRAVSQKDIPYLYDVRGMQQYPHIGIFGGSGSGKSYGLRVFLEELMQKNIPAIMVDPHYEMGFDEGDRAGEYEGRSFVVQVGRDVGVRFREINTADLRNLIGTSSELTESMVNVIEAMHWKNDELYTFRDRIVMLIEALELGSAEAIDERIRNAQSSSEKEGWENRRAVYKRFGNFPMASVRGVQWRLNRLEKQGIFTGSTEPVERALMEGKLVVLQGGTRLLQVFTTFLCHKLYNMRRAYKDSEITGEAAEPFVPFLICTDEAHNFAPQGLDIPSKSVFREIAQEGRKYGVFLVLATQRPSLLDNTVTAQLNTKLIFRTVRASDMQTIQEETDLSSDAIRRLPYLQSGDVFISESAVGRTVFARIRKNHTQSPHGKNPFDELRAMAGRKHDRARDLLLDKLPVSDPVMTAKHLEAEGKGTFTAAEIERMLDLLVEAGEVSVKENILGMRTYTEKTGD